MSNPYAPPRGTPPRRDDDTTPSAPASPPTSPAARPAPDSQSGRPVRRVPVRPEPDPQATRRATRRVMHFGLLMLAVIVITSLPFPWQLVGLLVAVVALVVGVRALVSAWRARVRGALVPALVVGVGLVGLLAAQLGLMLATWDIEMANQACVDGAITVGAQARCDAERQQALEVWLTRHLGTPPLGTTPTP